MLPSQHHASFSIALKRFMISLYARLMSFPHKINPLDYAMNIATVLLHVIKRQPRGRNIVLSGIVWLERCPS